jgi:hypothetical protein
MTDGLEERGRVNCSQDWIGWKMMSELSEVYQAHDLPGSDSHGPKGDFDLKKVT